MSEYKTHSMLNLFIGLPLCIAGLKWYYHSPIPLLITFAATFTYSTLFMSPDLDLAYQIKPWSLRGFFSLPFRLYAKAFRHRGISHSLFLGSLSRILWLSGLIALLFLISYCVLPGKYIVKVPNHYVFIAFVKQYQSYFWHGFGAICCADWGHLIVDHESGKF